MTEEAYSPIARALLGDSDEPDRNVPCMKCGRATECPGFLVASVRLWNRQEDADAREQNRRAHLISYSEICPCDECAPLVRAEKREEYMLECATTSIYLRELRAGKYNPESLAWLRSHDWGHEVHRVLSEEGTKGQ